jgi:hypothetical protein
MRRGRKRKKMAENKYDIIAETYLEVISDNEGGWIVNLVIESFMNTKSKLTHTMAEFQKMEDADEWADAYRFLYDKSIFQYELM